MQKKRIQSAFVNGVTASLSKMVDLTMLYRYYTMSFNSFYGKAFRENSSGNNNEQGVYIGTKVMPKRIIYFDANYDYFYFPWDIGKFHTGYSWLSKVTYEPNKIWLISLQHKGKKKNRKILKKEKSNVEVSRGVALAYMFKWQYLPIKSLKLKSELHCNSYTQVRRTTWGYGLLQRMDYKIGKLRLINQIVWFSTKRETNKITTSEPKMLYDGTSFRAHRHKGVSYCFTLCYKPIAYMRLECKYSILWLTGKPKNMEEKTINENKENENKIGSGNEELKGNFKNEIRVQIVFSF